jgi:hypothetical protein
MTAPALSLQSAMRGALISDAAMTALVPAANIYDRHARPEVFPSIILGETQEIADDMTLERHHFRLFPTIHVWSNEPSLIQVKAIAYQLRKTLVAAAHAWPFIDFRYENTRFLRDPSGEHSHGVVTFEALGQDALL